MGHPRGETKLVVSMNGYYTAIMLRDIFYIEVYKRIISIHHKHGITDTYAHLSEAEGALDAFGFIRAHRAYLVAVDAIRNLSATSITLVNGEEVAVGKKYYAAVKEAFLNSGIRLGK